VRKEEELGGSTKDEFRRTDPGAEQENKPGKKDEVTTSLVKNEGNKEEAEKGNLKERPAPPTERRVGKESGKQVMKEEGTEEGNVGGVEGQKKEMEKGGKAERKEAGRDERPPSPKRVKSEGAESGIPVRRKDLPNRLRYILVGKKELPPVKERRGRPFWAFVDFVTDDPLVCPLPFRF
jgi:hypothetical protein